MIAVDLIDDPRQLQQLATQWNPLLSRSHSKSIFLTWEWISTWLDVYQRGYDLLVLVAREQSLVCGIAPLVVRRDAEHRLEFAGQNEAYGEFLDFIGPVSLVDVVTPALCERLGVLHREGSWESLYFTTMMGDTPNLLALQHTFAKQNVAIRQTVSRTCPYVELPATWRDYLALKGPHFRRRVEYIRRRLGRRGCVTFEVAESAEQVEIFLNQFAHLHRRRWDKCGDRAFFRFSHRLAHALHQAGYLLLFRLSVGEEVVAIKYDLSFDNKVWSYSGGWSPEWRNHEVGSVLLGEIIRWAIAHGYREYDFLEQADWYKRRWSTAHREAVDLAYRTERLGYIFEEPTGAL